MILPNSGQAVVPAEKLTDYLLSDQHPTGRHKARFFRALGFSPEQPEILRLALLNHAQSNLVLADEVTPYGTKYVVAGLLITPNGTAALVCSVWIVESGSQAPRLITAFSDH